jgi:hypothetical protein
MQLINCLLMVVAGALTRLPVSTSDAQSAQTIDVPVVRGVPPIIDGDLSDSAWAVAALIPLHFQWFPEDGSTPSVTTECRLMATPVSLLVGCHALDRAPTEIVAIRRDRDAGEVDDGIAVTIDPFGDGSEAFRFRVSASGVISDSQVGRTTGTDAQWDAVWEGRSRREADGYSVELSIPFAALRMPAEARSQPTRVLIERFYPRRFAYRFAATALDRNEMCRTCQGLPIVLPTTVRGGHGILLQPTLVAASQRERSEHASHVDLGGAVRWQASPSTRLSATFNPDFSQVEADELDFEINRRFVLTFAERRPFFLEGREMLEGFGDLVFSRRMVDPQWGIRALSRGSAYSSAALVTRETSDTRIVPGPYSSTLAVGAGGATTGAARVRLTRGRGLVVGSTVTARNASLSRNVVGAVDTDLQFAGRHRVRMVVAASSSRYDESDSVSRNPNGVMARARYDLDGRSWGAEMSLRAISRDFRADAGLLQRVNVWGPEAQVRRMLWGSSRKWYSLITVEGEAQYLQTYEGRLIDGKWGGGLRWQGPRQSDVAIELLRRSSALDSLAYDYAQFAIASTLRGYSRWNGGVELTLGEAPDVDNGRLGRISALRANVVLMPHDAFTISGLARYEQLQADAKWVYRAAIGDLRIEFYPRLNSRIRFTAQYNGSRRNPLGGVVDGPSERAGFTFQALASQRIGTRALAFVGYVGSGSLVEGSPRWPAGRSLFGKVAWDFAR